jgi:hypothetical protein
LDSLPLGWAGDFYIPYNVLIIKALSLSDYPGLSKCCPFTNNFSITWKLVELLEFINLSQN